MSKIFLSLGSNLGDRLKNLSRAVLELKSQNLIPFSFSAVYETSPVDCENDSPAFLNAVIGIESDIEPDELINAVLDIEKKIGRKRTTINAPRIIDIDILLMGDIIADDERILLPHPRMHDRLFVLAPLREIAGNVIHPKLNKTIDEIYNKIKKSSDEEVRLFAPGFSIN